MINARWDEGEPTNVLAEAGVLVHQFDATEFPSEPWIPRGEHFSCTLANRRNPVLYSPTKAGLVLASANRVRCSYTRDGATAARGDGGCGGSQPKCTAQVDWGCVWAGPWTVAEMLAAASTRFAHGSDGNGQRFNEVMVDTDWYVNNMPLSLEAFFVPARGNLPQAARIHRHFLSHFGLSEAEVPLLVFHAGEHAAPWRRAGCVQSRAGQFVC